MDEQADDLEPIDDNEDLDEGLSDSVDWGDGDLEAAYLKAMSALEASESELSVPLPPAIVSNSDGIESDVSVALDAPIVVDAQPVNETPDEHESQTATSLAELFSGPEKVQPTESTAVTESAPETRMTPRQIIEACLFVGGSALTTKKIAGVLRGQFESDAVEREIDELNRQYAAENRPYEICFGEGGYRLSLRNEYERIRNKVFGLGPKEVRLSQEALEVLAVVAYHQPIKQGRVEELGKPGCGGVLRQLVRRELLAIERDPEQPREVNYITTPRFLSLFGIRNLDELPRHEQVSYK